MSCSSEAPGTIESVAELVGPAGSASAGGWHPGSGVVIANGSVRPPPTTCAMGEVAVSFADGSRRIATLAATDADADLAVLAVDTGDVSPVASSNTAPRGDGAPGIWPAPGRWRWPDPAAGGPRSDARDSVLRPRPELPRKRVGGPIRG